ncbi:MAG: GNAT family N-acetyltransferase, partial [Clostridia bacterium]|nr:GNAT family N-acetyltransferase [Clostridia bacterium]
MIRRAFDSDIPAVAAIYEAIHDREERGEVTIGWQRGVYPTADTAREAVALHELYVLDDGGRVVASGRINRQQMPAYAQVDWRFDAPDDRVLVLHTLTVDPAEQGRGYARQ